MRKSVAILAFLVIFGFLIMGAVKMRPFGDPNYEWMEDHPIEKKMDDYFINNSQEDDQTNNVVTAVLFDYRGLDTLGEATILFSAVSGVVTALRHVKKKKLQKEEVTSE